MVAVFADAGVKPPENWREIGLRLNVNLKGQLSVAEFFEGWSKNRDDDKKPSWENLAQVLENMDGYKPSAFIAKKKIRKCNVNIDCQLRLQSTMCLSKNSINALNPRD